MTLDEKSSALDSNKASFIHSFTLILHHKPILNRLILHVIRKEVGVSRWDTEVKKALGHIYIC